MTKHWEMYTHKTSSSVRLCVDASIERHIVLAGVNLVEAYLFVCAICKLTEMLKDGVFSSHTTEIDCIYI